MKIDKEDIKKVLAGYVILYAIVYITFKSVVFLMFPDFYFGPQHALGIVILITFLFILYEAFTFSSRDEYEDEDALENAAMLLIADIVMNGNEIKIPTYVVNETSKKLCANKLAMTIEEVDGAYVLKVKET